MLLKACLNGSRKPGEHPRLPLTPRELADDALRVVAAGAHALHIHPRNAQGAESLAAEDVAAALVAVHQRCPGIPVGVTTGFWIAPDPERRLQHMREWTVRPDFASVNFSEPGAIDLCTHFLARGIGVEAGLATLADARLLVSSGLADRCLRVLIEMDEHQIGSALAMAEEMIGCLDDGMVQIPRLLHGNHQAVVWPLLEEALRRGYETRIGLEDTLVLPDGRQAHDNAELVSRAVSLARQIGVL